MTKHNDHSRRDVLALLGSVAALPILPANARAIPGEKHTLDAPYTVSDDPWPYLRGNHRIRVYVPGPGRIVHVLIRWRRLDTDIEDKGILVFDPNDREVMNTGIADTSSESVDIFFEASQPGNYHIYYLPHKTMAGGHPAGGKRGEYLAPQMAPSPAWLRLFEQSSSISARNRIPQAHVVEFEARTAFDSFYPMEVPATREEVQTFCSRYSDPVFVFPECREHPIKMYGHLPLHWLRDDSRREFSGIAWRGEFYVMQLGVYATEASAIHAESITLSFDDLTGPNGETIAAAAWTCVNTDGVDVQGETFHIPITIDAGKVVPLWCGVQVPVDCKKGNYSGNLSVTHRGGIISIRISLEVLDEFVRAGGVDQLSRMARIEWLNSTLGLESSCTAPYTPLQLENDTVICLGREVSFGDCGLPRSIKAHGEELLAGPIEIGLLRGAARNQWTGTSRIVHASAAIVTLESHGESDDFDLMVKTTMEFDGGIACDVRIISKRQASLSDVALEIPYRADKVLYSVGMSLKGGTRPPSWKWTWTDQPQRWKAQGSNLDYFLWMGNVQSGLYCRLSAPLQDWQNEGKGGVTFAEREDRVLFRAYTGARRLGSKDVIHLSFRLLPTPVKPLDPFHWNYRYAHAYEPPQELRDLDATVINLHQGTPPNLYINYPFLNLDLLGPYVSEAHDLGMRVKLYYTMRELTTRLPELWTFFSLGQEIYRVGGTQGQGDEQLDYWLQEHVRGNYAPGWVTVTETGVIDTSLRVHSDSRLANFYIAGLKWLLDNVGIDGLYLDEIGYSRSIMQRVRRVLDTRPGAMIDMHGNRDWWSCNCPIGYYMEHLPYIDRLWLGEAFDPDSPPDFWLIEMSGLPFGLSSDLLERPNPWRGMLFGMTDRALYSGPSPTSIWRLSSQFGIEDAAMIGWWEKDALVRTQNRDVLATTYSKQGKALIALASWSQRVQQIQLQIDSERLGIDSRRAQLTAPELAGLQESQILSLDQPVIIRPGEGYLLLIEQA